MNITTQIAQHLRAVYFGGNWTTSCFQQHLDDLHWEQATHSIPPCNTIATLLFHASYYLGGIAQFLKTGTLEIKDRYSFDCPPIQSQQDWENLRAKAYADAEELAALIEQLPDSRLHETFVHEKYGSYYRNLCGLIEHLHYHLGQIVLLKKLLSAQREGRGDS
jgi:hypothetical protein